MKIFGSMDTTFLPSVALLLLLRILLCVPQSLAGIVKNKICEHHLASVSESGGMSQTDKSPFSITTTQTKYIPGQVTKVTIRATKPFVGFVLQARHFGTSEVLGHFTSLPPEVMTYSCQNTNDTLYAWFSRPRAAQNMTFSWLSPDGDSRTIHFFGTVYKDDTTFWTNLDSERFRKGFAKIDLHDCGHRKSCFRYTKPGEKSCTQDSCVYLVTSRVEGQNAHFEMSAQADWAAIGFSSDDKMGGDDVFMCMRTRTSGGEVRHYWNDYAYQPPHLQDNNPLYKQQVEVSEDGTIACRFSRPLKVANGNQFDIDLNNDWFQLYAWGPLSQSGTLMRHYLESPPVSAGKMTLLRNRDVIGGATGVRPSLACILSIAFVWIAFQSLLPTT